MKRRALLQGLAAALLAPFVERRSLWPLMTPGETAVHGPGGSFIRCHADGSLEVFTGEDIAAPAAPRLERLPSGSYRIRLNRMKRARAEFLRYEFVNDALSASHAGVRVPSKWDGRVSLARHGAVRRMVVHEASCLKPYGKDDCWCGAAHIGAWS